MPHRMSYEELQEEILRARKLLQSLETAAKEEEERMQHEAIDHLDEVMDDAHVHVEDIKTLSQMAVEELKALIERLHAQMHSKD